MPEPGDSACVGLLCTSCCPCNSTGDVSHVTLCITRITSSILGSKWSVVAMACMSCRTLSLCRTLCVGFLPASQAACMLSCWHCGADYAELFMSVLLHAALACVLVWLCWHRQGIYCSGCGCNKNGCRLARQSPDFQSWKRGMLHPDPANFAAMTGPCCARVVVLTGKDTLAVMQMCHFTADPSGNVKITVLQSGRHEAQVPEYNTQSHRQMHQTHRLPSTVAKAS